MDPIFPIPFRPLFFAWPWNTLNWQFYISDVKFTLPPLTLQKLTFYQHVASWQELLRISLHAADLSNPAKEFVNSRDWAVKVIDEFFLQGDCERQLNGKIKMPMNDRDLTSIKSSQVGFIDYRKGLDFFERVLFFLKGSYF